MSASAMYRLTHAYPDCPTCDRAVDNVEHESVDMVDGERYFDTTPSIHLRSNPFVLQPCGHQMYGCLIQDLGAADAMITEWHQTIEHSDISHAMGVR